MVANQCDIFELRNFDAMSLKSQKSRVTFCESDAIELDSLEPEVQILTIRGDVLGTIVEYENNSESLSIHEDFDDENNNEGSDFQEFDVSLMNSNALCVTNHRKMYDEKQMTVSICSRSLEKLCLMCSYFSELLLLYISVLNCVSVKLIFNHPIGNNGGI